MAAGDVFYFNEPPPDAIKARHQLVNSNQEKLDPYRLGKKKEKKRMKPTNRGFPI